MKTPQIAPLAGMTPLGISPSLADVMAMEDGPRKKFHLVKLLGPAIGGRRLSELGCREIVALHETAAEHDSDQRWEDRAG